MFLICRWLVLQFLTMTELKDSNKKRPLWFIFPGSQSEGSGRDLMKIPVFAATIERAAAVLRPFDIDLIWILTEAPETIFNDVTNCMVAIIAVQVALVDVLRVVGLHPDGIFAYSLGETGAAYADETLTVEQVVLMAYWRSRCLIEAKVPVGPKAVVPMTMDQFAKRCPPEIEIMVFALNGVVVVGLDLPVMKLVDDLSSEGINTKICGTNSLLFHTRYVEAAQPAFRKHLKSIICNPKPHSSKWISTSSPPDKWDSKKGKLIDADFFVNNLRVPVDLVTPYHAVPKNAVLVEISVNAKALGYMTFFPATITTIELIRKEAPDSALQLFESIGKIFEAMGQPPPVEQLSAVFGSNFTVLKGNH